MLSVIMPAYNEEESIALAVEEVRQDILDRVNPSELIVVNDGSMDSTAEILESLAGQDKRIRVLQQKNGGHGKALLTGLCAAQGDYLFLLDSDLQIPAKTFEQFWTHRGEWDGIVGVRLNRRDPRFRLWLSRMIPILIRFFFRVTLSDPNCPFKLMSRSCWEQSRGLIAPDTLAPSLFWAVLLRTQGMKLLEVEVPHQERSSGRVTLRGRRLLHFCWKAFFQLVGLRLRLAGIK